MDIKDRGNIKWTSLMLVEHRKKLEELKESENNRERPDLDEQFYEVLNYRIEEAIEKNIEVKITYYKRKEYREITTHINKYDPQLKKLIIKDKRIKKISLKNIVEIALLK
ncbi:MAG: YolD-like family protein [Halanaerobiales bacterium]